MAVHKPSLLAFLVLLALLILPVSAQTELSPAPSAMAVSFAPVRTEVMLEQAEPERFMSYGASVEVSSGIAFGSLGYATIRTPEPVGAASAAAGIYLTPRQKRTVTSFSILAQRASQRRSRAFMAGPMVSLSHRFIDEPGFQAYPQFSAAGIGGLSGSSYESVPSVAVFSAGAALVFGQAIAFAPSVAFTKTQGGPDSVGLGLQVSAVSALTK